jgi:hypothetical protein
VEQLALPGPRGTIIHDASKGLTFDLLLIAFLRRSTERSYATLWPQGSYSEQLARSTYCLVVPGALVCIYNYNTFIYNYNCTTSREIPFLEPGHNCAMPRLHCQFTPSCPSWQLPIPIGSCLVPQYNFRFLAAGKGRLAVCGGGGSPAPAAAMQRGHASGPGGMHHAAAWFQWCWLCPGAQGAGRISAGPRWSCDWVSRATLVV